MFFFIFVLSSLFIGLFNNCAAPSQTPSNPESPQSPSQAPQTCLEQFGKNTEWSGEVEVEIDGYSANAMEPKISADQVVLFWNDKPSNDTQMNIHYAVKQSNGRYQYAGTLPGTVDNSHLDGVPAVDANGNFYFISTRTYGTNSQTIYGGQAAVVSGALQINSVAAADAAVKLAGQIDMDIDVSWDGTLMIASRAKFSGKAYPDSSYLEIYSVNSRIASKNSTSAEVLKNVNLSKCVVYAATLSSDMKELYYTVFPAGDTVSNSDLKIVVSKRNSTSESFGKGQIISGINGTATEGPAITQNDSGKTLFYHKLDPATGRFKIYKVTRP